MHVGNFLVKNTAGLPLFPILNSFWNLLLGQIVFFLPRLDAFLFRLFRFSQLTLDNVPQLRLDFQVRLHCVLQPRLGQIDIFFSLAWEILLVTYFQVSQIFLPIDQFRLIFLTRSEYIAYIFQSKQSYYGPFARP